MLKQASSILRIKVSVLVNERYRTAFNYGFYILILNSQQYDNGILSKMPRMQRRVAVQIKIRTFNGKDSISILSYLTELKRACD